VFFGVLSFFLKRKKERKGREYDILVRDDSLLKFPFVSIPNPPNTHKHGITPDRLFML